jgi:predicted methyltransferase
VIIMTIAFRHRSTATLAAALCFATLTSVVAAKPPVVPKPVAAAVADPARPQADRDRDADRKPAECIAFAGLKPGQRIADLLPGGGYFTRIFSGVVGPKGQVFAVATPSARMRRRTGRNPRQQCAPSPPMSTTRT